MLRTVGTRCKGGGDTAGCKDSGDAVQGQRGHCTVLGTVGTLYGTGNSRDVVGAR